MKKDYYQILEVDRGATQDDIKRAFRRLALKYHPDHNPEDNDAEEKFKELNEAYSCLSDSQKKGNYDRFGSSEGVGAGFGGFGGFDSAFGDMFEDVFGDFLGAFTGRRTQRRMRGSDLRYDLEITLEEAAFGTEKIIDIMKWEHCGPCGGTGSKSKRPSTCPECGGKGQIYSQQGFFSVSRTCPRCGGRGSVITDVCPSCNGQSKVRNQKTISVKIPPGVDTDSRLKMSGEGEPGLRGGLPGDLFIYIDVKPHEVFHRKGLDIYFELPLTFPQAALGTDIEIPTLDGKHKLKIPSGSQPGTLLHIKGKGIPKIGSRARGDQIVVVNLIVPKKLNQRQRDLMEEFQEISENETTSGFKDKLKSIFTGTS